MINTLYLPELREMLAEANTAELQEFCTALHPARTAEFMEGLSPDEAWQVLQHADPEVRAEVFSFFDHEKQNEIIETQDREEIADLIARLAPDDRVDRLSEVDPAVVGEILPLVPAEDRRDILRLQAFPEDTAGSLMTTDFAKLRGGLTVGEALQELQLQAEGLETIYYLYIVDDEDHLRGVVSTRQLVSSMGRPDTSLNDLMEADVVSVDVAEDQEEVARKVARYDMLAIPVVDQEHHILGIITHDDAVDVFREEATEDAHLLAGVNPLEVGYLRTHLFTLCWKRGLWLTILFFGALFTAIALSSYKVPLEDAAWLIVFIPLVISCGGNTGSQAATLVITALTSGDVRLADWRRIALRELLMGIVLGGFLGLCGMLIALMLEPDARLEWGFLILPLTVLLVVTFGTLIGAMLPLLFHRLGLDPALMSNPFVAGIVDIVGIVIYMNVALAILSP